MTDFDRKLIEKADRISRYHWRDIDVLITVADTSEAKQRLRLIRDDLRFSVRETI